MSTENIRPEARTLIERGNVTLAEWKAFRGNSWEFEALIPALTDEALAYVAQHMLDNCLVVPRRPAPTYNDAVVLVLVPELLRRLAEVKR